MSSSSFACFFRFSVFCLLFLFFYPEFSHQALTPLPSLGIPSLTPLPSLAIPSLTPLPSTIPSLTPLPSLAIPSLTPLPSLAIPSLTPLPSLAIPSLTPLPSLAIPSLTPLPSLVILPSITIAIPTILPSFTIAIPTILPSFTIALPTILPSFTIAIPTILPSFTIAIPTLIPSLPSIALSTLIPSLPSIGLPTIIPSLPSIGLPTLLPSLPSVSLLSLKPSGAEPSSLVTIPSVPLPTPSSVSPQRSPKRSHNPVKSVIIGITCGDIDLNCDDSDPCTTDFCSGSPPRCVHQSLSCEDDDLCTTDRCSADGTCSHTIIDSCLPPPGESKDCSALHSTCTSCSSDSDCVWIRCDTGLSGVSELAKLNSTVFGLSNDTIVIWSTEPLTSVLQLEFNITNFKLGALTVLILNSEDAFAIGQSLDVVEQCVSAAAEEDVISRSGGSETICAVNNDCAFFSANLLNSQAAQIISSAAGAGAASFGIGAGMFTAVVLLYRRKKDHINYHTKKDGRIKDSKSFQKLDKDNPIFVDVDMVTPY